MIKHFFIYILAFALIVGILPVQAFARDDEPAPISVYLDGFKANFDVPPTIIDGRTLVPFRAIAEILGILVEWEDATKTIRANQGDTTVILQIGNPTAIKNNMEIPLQVPPIIIDGRTLIPLRFFSEAFGCEVGWEDATKTVSITSPVKEMKITGFYGLGAPGATSSWEDLFSKAYPERTAGHTGLVSTMAFAWYTMDSEGNLKWDNSSGWRKPSGFGDVLAAAEEYGISTEMAINMTDTGAAIRSLLTDEAAVQRAVEGIAAEAAAYDGVNLDFEGLGWGDSGEELEAVRVGFTRFVEVLSVRLKASGVKLTLTLHPLNSEYLGYDYSDLGKLADTIIIMAYDYNMSPSPEPVARVRQAVEMALDQVPAQKLLLGISTHNETAGTIGEKVGIAKRYNLQGIALWRLGLVGGDIWAALGKTVRAGR